VDQSFYEWFIVPVSLCPGLFTVQLFVCLFSQLNSQSSVRNGSTAKDYYIGVLYLIPLHVRDFKRTGKIENIIRFFLFFLFRGRCMS
jgi:hypothetical protein